MAELNPLQHLLETTIKQIPQLLLENRLTEKFKESGLTITQAAVRKAARHVLSGSEDSIRINGTSDGDDVSIEITDEDIEYVVSGTERFHRERLEGVLREVSSDIANLVYKDLAKRWSVEHKAQKEDIEQFRGRLEHRWGKGLAKLRMLLTIVGEWAQGAHEHRQHTNGGKLSRYDDVMLRLHVRACQVTHEVIVLLENGLADGAMARWRTLHEITIVAAIVARFGDEIAERYTRQPQRYLGVRPQGELSIFVGEAVLQAPEFGPIRFQQQIKPPPVTELVGLLSRFRVSDGNIS